MRFGGFMKEVCLKIKWENWGRFGPNDLAFEREWTIYSDLTVELKETFNTTNEAERIKKYILIIGKEFFDKIFYLIDLAKQNDVKVEAVDGYACEFIQYKDGLEIWKRDLGYIYDIEPLEEIVKILLSLRPIEPTINPNNNLQKNKYDLYTILNCLSVFNVIVMVPYTFISHGGGVGMLACFMIGPFFMISQMILAILSFNKKDKFLLNLFLIFGGFISTVLTISLVSYEFNIFVIINILLLILLLIDRIVNKNKNKLS